MSMLQQASSQLASDALSLTNVSVNWRAWSFTSLGLFRPNLRITKEGKETYVVTCVLRCVGLEIPHSLCKSFRSISLLKQTYSQKHVGSIAVWYFTFITLSSECGALEVQCKGSRRKSSCYQQPERNMGSLWRSSHSRTRAECFGGVFLHFWGALCNLTDSSEHVSLTHWTCLGSCYIFLRLHKIDISEPWLSILFLNNSNDSKSQE